MIEPIITVGALTQGQNVPSTRFRVLQHVTALAEQGILLKNMTARFGAYPPPGLLARAAWLPCAAMESCVRVLQSNRFDIRLLQRELVSTVALGEALLRRPFVFDVDDAIFLHRRGQQLDSIARRASLTICGNKFLAEHYERLGHVAILPTAVDTQRFVPAVSNLAGRAVVGWSGSSSGLPFLYENEDALKVVLQTHPDAVLLVVADRPPAFQALPVDRVIHVPWSPDSEVQAIQRFTVGLMPLPDTPWSRGKCSFKMLTYMAVGVPVVVSPVGMNVELLALGACGYAARHRDDWIQAIGALLDDREAARRMGRTGRDIVMAHFSRDVIAPRLARLLRSVASGAPITYAT